MSRPSAYRPEIGEIICDRLADGESMRAICRDDNMPDRKTVRAWEDAFPEFAAKCAHARVHRAEFYSDRMDEITEQVANGHLDAGSARVILSNYQWKAEKLNRALYGQVIQNEHTGKGGGPIQTQALSDQDLDARIAELADKTGQAGAAGAARGKAPKARR